MREIINNKRNIEEDIKILKEFWKYTQDRVQQAIENILADRERLKKENTEMQVEIAEQVYFGSMPIEEIKQLQAKANKYDSLVEKIEHKFKTRRIELLKKDKETENDIVLDTLQELLNIEKE